MKHLDLLLEIDLLSGSVVEYKNKSPRPRDDLIRGVYEWNSQEDKSLNTIHIIG